MNQVQVKTTASGALAADSVLDRQTRSLMGLYVGDMNEAAMRLASLSETCGRGAISQQNVEATRNSAADWLKKNALVRGRLEEIMKARGFDLPVTQAADGRRSLCLQ